MRVLVTGGAGFIGSHLCDRLHDNGHDVICVDNLFSGSKENVRWQMSSQFFEFIRHDITIPLYIEVDQIYHLACPASPVYYQHNPIKTTKTNILGTLNMLGLAKRVGARILLASTSEIYGDPKVSPQHEGYWGNVNPIGPRSCYDEGKRVAETLMVDYQRQHKVDIRIARIFNTYGPRMAVNDGRVVSNFIVQALEGKALTVYGDGSQTRSFCYINDMVDGLVKLMESSLIAPVNLGNPEELKIENLAQIVIKLTNSNSKIEHCSLPQDDPMQRRPDINVATRLLGWVPEIGIKHGLEKTIEYFKTVLEKGAEIRRR